MVYADFETILKPSLSGTVEEEEVLSSSFGDCGTIIKSVHPGSSSASRTTSVASHMAYSFGYYIKCNFNDRFSKYVTYRGVNCSKNFVNTLRDDMMYIYDNYLSVIAPMQTLSKDDEIVFSSSDKCSICKEYLGSYRVRDHCHLSGKFRGAAHSSCNLNFKIPHF
ncbi:MAG TPA: hypothetical protein DDZ41_00790, partial [Flavobacterium sp.]|nr:hypothetical protein [Flavobacterium sp.]